ncbi:hypothetical protein P168DRAFT_287532 [Aspergillus campestris IBT 28561]|uniref:Siderophore biosynthesis enzyme n=1 Tax=Aspergillus campestris (strain IBT 28561) TaxID=1392248 RepID=A0A2I1DAX2_ASPC2|nr:uncharacterized protein P168DRAFT_287532 [Aspergillus campestris IBT 28561]PKY07023.1 hypothetical protein P168DRAFT_287532 [Aspergillus campestris IBT 28561]
MPRLLTLTTLLTTLSLLTSSQARTDLEGCTSTATRNQWNEASVLWYVPGTGEICDFPDCGGGRAPPKYDNPACPGYTGSASYEPTFLPGFGKATATATATASAGGDADDDDAAPTAGASATGGTRPGVTGFVSATGKSVAGSASGSATASSSAAASPSGSSRAGVTKSASTSTASSAKTSSSPTDGSVPTSNAAAGGYARIGGGVVGVVAAAVALL